LPPERLLVRLVFGVLWVPASCRENGRRVYRRRENGRYLGIRYLSESCGRRHSRRNPENHLPEIFLNLGNNCRQGSRHYPENRCFRGIHMVCIVLYYHFDSFRWEN